MVQYSGKKFDKLLFDTNTQDPDYEAWIVNTLKVRLLSKLENLLESEGRDNARRLLLVPVFTISELVNRVREIAPELTTLFYLELSGLLK